MRFFTAAAITLAMGVIAFFLLGKLSTEKIAAKAVRHEQHVSLFHYFSGSLSGGLAEMVDTVNDRNPDQKVIAQPLDHEAFKSMILSTLDRGTPPDLFTYWAGSKTMDLVEQGKLEPIDDIWQEPLAARFTTTVAETASTYHGKKYLLPITQHFVVFFYNKHVFDQEGLTAPATWADLTRLAQILKEKGLIAFALGARERWPAQFWFDYLLLRTAGPEYRQALMEGDAFYTDPEVKKVYEMWGSLLTNGYFNSDANTLDWAEATQLVCSGKAAMTLMGTWAIQAFTGSPCGLAEETDFDFFIFPIIDPAVPMTALGPVDGIVLSKSSAHHDFAKQVLRYFSEREPQQRLAEGSGAFAPSNQVPAESYSPLRRRLLASGRASSYWAFNYDLATESEIANLGMDSFNELIAFPDQSPEILEHLHAAVETIRAAIRP